MVKGHEDQNKWQFTLGQLLVFMCYVGMASLLFRDHGPAGLLMLIGGMAGGQICYVFGMKWRWATVIMCFGLVVGAVAGLVLEHLVGVSWP